MSGPKAKGILLILDGMEDGPLPPFENAPPFQAPALKTLMHLKKLGESGSFLTTPPGHSPDTRTGILTLLATPPAEIPAGRAYLEALSAGVPVGEGDAVFRCNLVQVDSIGHILHPNDTGLSPRRVAAATEAIASLAADLGLGFSHLAGYRSLLTLPGGYGIFQGVKNAPPHQSIGKMLSETQFELAKLSVKIQYFTDKQTAYLKDFPGIAFALWDGSGKTTLPPLRERLGAKIALISATPIVLGMGEMLGLPTQIPPGATGETDTNLSAKATAALALLPAADGVILHVNGADEAAHRRDAAEKCRFLRRVDGELLPALWDGLKVGERILITSDHATYAATGAHGGTPQPFLLLEKGKTLSKRHGNLPSTEALPLLLGLHH